MSNSEDYRFLFTSTLGSELKYLERIGTGKNARVFKLVLADGRKCVAKIYHRHDADQRDRLGVEFGSMSFLWKYGIRNIPQPLSKHTSKGFCLYEYINGQSIEFAKLDSSDIDQAVKFLIDIDGLKNLPEATGLPPASEAFFCWSDIVANIQWRFNRLACLTSKDLLVLELRKFLGREFSPFFDLIRQWSRARMDQSGLSTDNKLSFEERTLSPSDFGFHNSLRRPDGSLGFFDFEYFGWDDPAKMIIDFILHPGMDLKINLKKRFWDGLLEHFGRSPRLPVRLSALYPIFGLKWCLILLNEFVPADATRRNFAASEKMDEEQRRIEQLGKARRILLEVEQRYERKFDLD